MKKKSWKESIVEKAKKAAENTSSLASKTSNTISQKSSTSWSKSKDIASGIADSTSKKAKFKWESTSETLENVALQNKVKFKDDVTLIKQNCDVLNNLANTQLSPVLYQSLLYAGAGMGLFSTQTELARWSRNIMDVNTAQPQKVLEMIFGESSIKEISQWMDTAPGFNVIGGGVTHRVQHGHDIEALVQLANDHNIAGVAEWLNHVVLRDFWTPAGVPYLPIGSGSIYDWLTSIGVGKEMAASFLSLNAWQAMTIIMTYKSGKKMYKLVREQINNKKARQLLDRGQELENVGDLIAANECYDKVLSYTIDNQIVNLWFAMKFLHKGQQEKGSELVQQHFLRSFNIANGARLKLIKDQSIPYEGGIEVSLRGVLTTTMATTWLGVSQNGNVEAIKGAIASGVEDFIKMANKLRDSFLDRPFSAIANEVLALKLLMSAPFDIPTSQTPLTIRNSIFESLNNLTLEKGNAGDYAKELLEGLERQYPIKQHENKLIPLA